MTIDLWARLLLLTVLVEAGIAALLADRAARRRTVLCSVLANFLTHPPATLLVGLHGFPIVPVELAVIAVEAPAYRLAAGLPWRRAVLIAVVANAVTWALSYVL